MQESLLESTTDRSLRPFDDRALKALLINAFVRFKLIPMDINHESQIFGAAICAGPLLLMGNSDGKKFLVYKHLFPMRL